MVSHDRSLLPDSPGAWLTFYRLQFHPQGFALSPEQVAAQIGVSGSTLRRWENNVLLPEPDDLTALANVYELQALQRSFLQRCLLRTADQSLDRAAFEGYVRSNLSHDRPVILLDELFFPVAWNSLVAALEDGIEERLHSSMHPLAYLWPIWSEGELDVDRLRDAMRLVWYFTSTLCRKSSYQRLMTSLTKLMDFAKHWSSISVSPSDPINPSLAAAVFFNSKLNFNLHFGVIEFPPSYYLLEYRPVGHLAIDRLQQLRSQDQPGVRFAIGRPE